MKIAPKSAEPFLAAPQRQCRGLLIYGPDNGLVRARAKQAARAALSGSDDPFARAELSEADLLSDPARLADELSAISLMAPERVIMVQAGGDKLARTIESALPYLNPAAFLLVTADELSARSALRALFEKEPQLAALACYKDEMRDVQAVVRAALDAAGISADREVTEYLAAQLGNDRGVTNQELEKIVTYAGESRQLRLEDVRALVDYNRDTGLDDIVNAVADRNLPALESALGILLREGAQPVAYLRALQRYFNRLYRLKAQVIAGQSAEQAVNALRPPVFFRQIPVLTRHVQSWGMEQIVRALALLTSAELACKTSDLPAVPASSRLLFKMMQFR